MGEATATQVMAPGLTNVMDKVDHVLVMTVNPGFGGQNYIPTMLEKIKKIRKWAVDGGFDIDIEVDGGVKADWTIAQCADAGANCFIARSPPPRRRARSCP